MQITANRYYLSAILTEHLPYRLQLLDVLFSIFRLYANINTQSEESIRHHSMTHTQIRLIDAKSITASRIIQAHAYPLPLLSRDNTEYRQFIMLLSSNIDNHPSF